MSTSPADAAASRPLPILLFDDECSVCRRMARWVEKSAHDKSGGTSIIVRPIGEDPEALRLLNPELNIWDAYATSHLLMPDGSIKLGGEAVAEVLRNSPSTNWFAWSFAFSVFGFRPFQTILNISYAILSDVRPVFGCKSCGAPGIWLRPIEWVIKGTKTIFGGSRHPSPTPHFTVRQATARQASPTVEVRLPQAGKQ
jgi:predicted DCC family thiol-disulfide oxidoreductase YuxK